MRKLQILKEHIGNLQLDQSKLRGKVVVITGASRGIGLAIAKKCALHGAKIAILAKTAQPHPKLPGTIYTAAQQIMKLGGDVLPLKCDIRFEEQIQACAKKIQEKFGGVDILVNNASAINLTKTLNTPMKKFDLMHSINARGTFMSSKIFLPLLLKSSSPQILTIAPPLVFEKVLYKQHLAYTISKIYMSMMVYSLAEQFKQNGIKVNALWPKRSVATAAIKNSSTLGGLQRLRNCRKDEIVSDAAYLMLTNSRKDFTGKFYFDEDILKQNGVTDLSKYKMDDEALERLRTSSDK